MSDVDALLHATKCDARAWAAEVERLPARRRRGERQLREVARLADHRAESPPESILRVMLIEAGLPAPVPQYVVRDGSGSFVARVDLGWPRLKVAVEYDGRYHDDPRQYARDRARLNALRAAGWQVLVIDASQLRNPARVVDLVGAVLAG